LAADQIAEVIVQEGRQRDVSQQVQQPGAFLAGRAGLRRRRRLLLTGGQRVELAPLPGRQMQRVGQRGQGGRVRRTLALLDLPDGMHAQPRGFTQLFLSPGQPVLVAAVCPQSRNHTAKCLIHGLSSVRFSLHCFDRSVHSPADRLVSSYMGNIRAGRRGIRLIPSHPNQYILDVVAWQIIAALGAATAPRSRASVRSANRPEIAVGATSQNWRVD
jgi:hypothetical protein